jgi:hypothetical protein
MAPRALFARSLEKAAYNQEMFVCCVGWGIREGLRWEKTTTNLVI